MENGARPEFLNFKLTTDWTTEWAASGGKVAKTEDDNDEDELTESDGMDEYIFEKVGALQFSILTLNN